MLCPECRTENPDASKFCFKCGAKLGQPATEPAVRAPEVRRGGVGGRVVAIAGLLALLVLVAAAGIFLLRQPESTPSESGVSQQATRVDEPSGRPTTAPAKTPLPEPSPEDPLVYPGAQVLDISSVEWDELAPPIGIMGEPEALLQHRASRTQDLARKIVDYYDQAMFDANWQSMQAGWESDGGWTYNRFRKGDDELSVGIIDNLPSALIAHFPDIGLESGDTLIIVAIGNPLNAYLARGRDLLQAGDWEAAKNYAERVASSRLRAGVGMDDPYVQDAVTLLAEALRQMTPVDAARLWFRDNVTADVFGAGKEEALLLMRRLGLVREYEGGIIDSYTPTGEWQEISNDETTAVVELVGVAVAKMSNRLIPQAEVESFDYRLQLTLQRDEEGIWGIDEDAGFIIGDSDLQPPAARRARLPAGDDVPLGDNPRLALPGLVKTNYTYDFGRVPPDEIVETNITVENKGTKPLVIKSVRASCGCVAANTGEDTISPGWSTQLRVIYDPTYNNDAGKQITRQIIIESNDPAAPVVEFTIRAEVETSPPSPQPEASEQDRSVIGERFDISLTVRENGDVDVVEARTIGFKGGPFRFGFRTIPLSRLEGITNVELHEGDRRFEQSESEEPYTFRTWVEGGEFNLRWYFPQTSDSIHTYTLKYTAKDAVRIYEGGDQIWWTAVESDRGYPVLMSQVTVHLPEGVDEIQKWESYGAAAQADVIDTRTIVFTAQETIRPGQGFEVRAQFPHGVVGKRREGGILALTGSDPATLDPHLATDFDSATYIVEIFSGLVTLDPDLDIIPDLAKDWEVDDAGTTYTFYLREDAQFHDGKHVTAQDFKWSFERALDPETNSPVASLYLNDIVGAMDKLEGRADEVEGIQVIDDHTLRITIGAPKAYFLAKLTYPTGFVLDRENVESGGRTWADQPNGTGAFRLGEYRLGEEIVLERNAFYYGEPQPSLQRVRFLLAGGSSMIMYESGDIDTTPVGLAGIKQVQGPTDPLHEELTVVAPTLSTFYVGLNNNIAPFDDPKVRQAFNYAIDKEVLANVVFRRTRVPAEGILPPRMPGYNPDLDIYDFDPERAKELIAESNYGSVNNLPAITLTVSGAGSEPGIVATAVIGMLEQNLGVEVSVGLVEPAVFLTEAGKANYQMFILGWSADYPDPQNFLDILFHSKSASNHINYSNPEVDRLLEEARIEQDHDKRMRMYQKIERMIMEDAPWISLFHSAEYWLTKPYVRGMVYPPAIAPRLKYVWLDQ